MEYCFRYYALWQILFKNDTRICHTGLVIGYVQESRTVITSEGNTFSAPGVIANGGCVRTKQYPVDYDMIAGYGVPAYNDGNFVFTPHWVRSGDKWYYRIADGVNAHGWKVINHHWYLFDDTGDLEISRPMRLS